MHKINRWITTCILVILVAVLAILLVQTKINNSKRTLELKKAETEMNSSVESYTFNVFSENSDKFSKTDKLVTSEEFYNEYKNINYNGKKNASVRYKTDIVVEKEDLLVLYFVAYTEDISAKIDVKVGEHFAAEYPVTTEKTEYYIPITDISEIDMIRIDIITDTVEMNFGDLYLLDYHTDKSVTDIKTGMFNLEDSEEIQLNSEDRIQTDASTAAVTDGEYLYSVNKDTLSIYDINNDDRLIGTLDDLGQTRDVQLCKDNSLLVIASRESGVFFVDISDATNPEVASHYDSAGMSVSVEVCGDYVFVANRYFGTEIIDISDAANPAYVSGMSSEKEHVASVVSGNYLYVACWAQQMIEIYDISNIVEPNIVNTIKTDGNVYGLYTEDDYLYVATGYNSQNVNDDLTDCGYGGGNGMEIYSIEDKENPEWISGVKTDGRYYSRLTGIDTWKIYVSAGVAYLTNSVNGVYVYDVSNPYAPKRNAHYVVKTFEDSESRAEYDKTLYIYPYKSEAYYNESVSDVVLNDGAIYICGYSNSVYKVNNDEAKLIVVANSNPSFELSEKESDEIDIKGYDTQVYTCDTAIYAAQPHDKYIYAACGSSGIHILDEDLNLIEVVETEGFVKDLKIYDNYLYTAQDREGLVIYSIDGTSLEEVGKYNIDDYTRTCSSIELTSDGKYLVAQFGTNIVKVLDVENVSSPKETIDVDLGTDETMRYRNICSGIVDDRYVGIYTSKNIYWIDVKAEDAEQAVKSTDNVFYSEEQGIAAYGEYVIAMYEGGYVYYDPNNAADNLEVIDILNSQIRGKMSANNGIMVVSNAKTNTVDILNIEQLDSPSLISEFKLDSAPDVATITDDYILIPAKHSGLIKLSK